MICFKEEKIIYDHLIKCVSLTLILQSYLEKEIR